MKKNNIFWISYSDLMTSLFFIMLVLFVLTISYLKIKNIENERLVKELTKKQEVTEQEKKKVREIADALKNIDPNNFFYNETYKKHILKIDLIDNNGDEGFPRGSSNMMDLNLVTRIKLGDAGNNLKSRMKILSQRNPNIQYLIIIEGQASIDYWPGNDELSYKRAIGLRDFWFKTQNQNAHQFIKSNLPNCEVIIAGSGQYGIPRDIPDTPPTNQRFLVTIIPKYGEIENNK
jgi:hypothetical protein